MTMKNIYQNMYDNQKNLGNLAENPRVKIMLSMIDKLDLQNKNILDIGCYDGTFLSLIKNQNNNFYGLETSDWGVEKTQEKGINSKGRESAIYAIQLPGLIGCPGTHRKGE